MHEDDTTEAVAASRWLRLGEVLEEAQHIIRDLLAGNEGWRKLAEERAKAWLEEYDAHQIAQREEVPR